MDQTNTSWVSLLGGSDRRGGTAATRRTGPQELVWKATLPESVRSSPIFAAGVVYVTCLDGRLHAFDGRTGRERWSFAAGAPIHSTPSLAG